MVELYQYCVERLSTGAMTLWTKLALAGLIVFVFWSVRTSSAAQVVSAAAWETMTANNGLMASQPNALLRLNDGTLIISFKEGIQIKTSRHSTDDRWIDASNSNLSGEMVIRLLPTRGPYSLVTLGSGDAFELDSSAGTVSPVDAWALGCRSSSSPSTPVRFTQPVDSGILWASQDSLWVMPELLGSCVRFTGLPPSYSGWAYSYLKDAEGWWIGTYEDGLWRFEVDARHPTHVKRAFKIPIRGGRIRALWKDGSFLWIATSGAGLVRYSVEEGTMVVFSRHNSGETRLSGAVVSDLVKLSDSIFLVGTTTGLDLVNAESETVSPISIISSENRESISPEVVFLHLDKWGTVWVGHKEGISYTSVESILSSTLSLDTIGQVGPVSAIEYLPDQDRLWFGSNGSIFSTSPYGSSPRTELTVSTATGFVSNNTISGILSFNDRLIASTGSHGVIFKHGTRDWVSHSFAPEEASPNQRSKYDAVRSLALTDGHLMVATEGAGLLVSQVDFTQGSVLQVDQPSGLLSSLAPAGDGLLLVGSSTQGGLWYHSDSLGMERALPWKNVDSIVDYSMVQSVATASGGRHFAASSGGLIYWSNADSVWGKWSHEEGLPAQLVNNVKALESGDVWFSTDKAVCRWQHEKDRPDCIGVIRPRSAESIQPRSMEVTESHVVVGTTTSVRFIPRDLFDTADSRRLKPLKLLMKGDRGETLSFEQNDGTFQLHPLTRGISVSAELSAFDRAEDVRFSYQILEIDPLPIISDGTVMEVMYPNLPHRSKPYVLQVGVRNDSGELYSSQLSFVLPLPFWQTRWFLFISILSLSGISVWQMSDWLQRRRREARELQMALATGREQERANLSRQIHDLALQHLYVVRQNLNRLELVQESDTFASIERSVAEATQELRRLCGELLPPSLGPFGLEAAVNSFLQGIRSAKPDLNIALDINIRVEPSTENALSIVRALQASISNVIRHAEASCVEITVGCDGEVLELNVDDDGIGFAIPTSLISLARKRHYGLLGLHELAKQHGGDLTVESVVGKGTQVRFRIPNSTATPS